MKKVILSFLALVSLTASAQFGGFGGFGFGFGG